MAHRIFGERFLSRTEPAWHSIGITFPADEEVRPSDAVARVSGDITIEAKPLYFEHDGTRIDSQNRAIVRLPTKEDKKPKVFGITSERWTPISYPTLAKSLDRIDSRYKVETCGLLCEGELLFLALRGEDWSVLGDEMRSYMAFNLSLRPGTGHRAFHTPVRVVCWNTNTAAIAQSKIDLRIPHTPDAAQQIGIVGDLISRYRKAQLETQRIFEAFATTPAPQGSVDAILDAAFPAPTLPPILRMLKGTLSEAENATFRRGMDSNALQSLVDAEERYETAWKTTRQLRSAGNERFHAFEPKELQGTVWAAFNSATEVSDWRGDGKTVAESVLIGSRNGEKARAFEAAYALVEA